MQFGPLQLVTNLFLSPLAGYTNLPFRLVLREVGEVEKTPRGKHTWLISRL